MAYVSLPRRLVTLLMISTVMVSCSAEGLVPPAEVDGTTRVSAIRSSRQQGYSAPSGAVYQAERAGQASDYPAAVSQPMPEPYASQDPLLQSPQGGQGYSTLDTQHQARMAASGHSASTQTMSNQAMPNQATQGQTMSPQPMAGSQIAEGEGGVNMDSMLGVEPVRGLAEEQDADIAEGVSEQPVVDGIGTDNPMAVSPPRRQQSAGQSRLIPPPPVGSSSRRQPVEEVAMLMPNDPMARGGQSNRSSMPPGVMPSSEVACRSELRRLGVAFRDVARIADGPTCGIDYPIELSGLASGVAIRPAVKLNCQVTLAFAKWVKFELVPSSRFRYLSGVGRITPMGGYSCRKMNSRSSNPWSEHARGNAIDIGTITLKNGKEIDVRSKNFFAFREKALLKAVRSDSCKYFSTVLGPGSDPNHWNHFHFDLRTRKSGYRHCD
ncbi:MULTISPECIES: extensin-like domain-containing protein [Rhizobium/Agrobacterium group]|uniref:extensin-like domain-containing protein n=1 Tax=Rhizobium/Agrobacterium group TaxID=227290 RepID=UPI0023006D89|nr:MULTISPECIES: extensin family protein [Rhizobium/Agrobacterium group]MDA5635869.1 extensin family protein [Agrobacterium sp. ST15.16.024]MDF1892055.1 extensin family protein [Rhizobium rhizogenes]